MGLRVGLQGGANRLCGQHVDGTWIGCGQYSHMLRAQYSHMLRAQYSRMLRAQYSRMLRAQYSHMLRAQYSHMLRSTAIGSSRCG